AWWGGEWVERWRRSRLDRASSYRWRSGPRMQPRRARERALAVALERELIRGPVLPREGRGHRLRHIRAATRQRVGQERSAVVVARKMPGGINRVVPDQLNRVSARSVRYDKRRDVGA